MWNENAPASSGQNHGAAGGGCNCSFPRDRHEVTAVPTHSRECNALPGYDGPSGVGSPRTLGLFHPTNPTVTITRPRTAKAGARVPFVPTCTSGYRVALTITDSRYQQTIEATTVTITR